ncbi:hypothetical protein A4G19_03690 [Pasteurellaceae bacterium Macca]|nr:hypothetical protein [Pasteurellaceae bacterium Macca]
MFDEKFFLNVGMALVSALVGWLIKVIFDRNNEVRKALDELKGEFKAFQQYVEAKYQQKELAKSEISHLEQTLTEIKQMLKNIEAKVDKKADK